MGGKSKFTLRGGVSLLTGIAHCQWQDIDECIDLEDTEEEDSELLKGFGEEVPEETEVRRLVRYSKAARCAQHTIINIHVRASMSYQITASRKSQELVNSLETTRRRVHHTNSKKRNFITPAILDCV